MERTSRGGPATGRARPGRGQLVTVILGTPDRSPIVGLDAALAVGATIALGAA